MTRPHHNLRNDQKMNGQLNVTKGKVRLEFFDSGEKTQIKDLLTTPPFLVQRALYPDDHYPTMAHVYLMSSSGGVIQGDNYDICITAGTDTISHVTTQAATKVYSADGNSARQNIAFYLHKNSYLEFAPFQIIPFKSSRYFHTTKIYLDKGAVLFYSEVLVAGRIASSERYEMDISSLKIQAFDFSGIALFTDLLRIEPKGNKSLAKAAFGNKNIFATIYLVGDKIESNTMELIKDMVKDKSLMGYSILPHECGIVIRILSDDQDHVFSEIFKLSRKARSLFC